MLNKSTQFAQNTSVGKQKLNNVKSIDYAKNLAEFRNIVSAIDSQLKEGKDNSLTIKACQNLIRTLSALDLPADVKRHELAVAPSSVQKLYQQMRQSKNGNSGSSKTRQEVMHNAIQQSLKDQIANLHNMSKSERMEFYKRIMTAESLQDAINKGFVVNDEYAEAFIDKAKTDAQRLAYLKNRTAELQEKIRNGTATQEERAELSRLQAEIPDAERKVADNRKTASVIREAHTNGKTKLNPKNAKTFSESFYGANNLFGIERPGQVERVSVRGGGFEANISIESLDTQRLSRSYTRITGRTDNVDISAFSTDLAHSVVEAPTDVGNLLNSDSVDALRQIHNDAKSDIESDFWTKMDTPVVSNSSIITSDVTSSEQTEPQNNLVLNQTGKNRETEEENATSKQLSEQSSDLTSNNASVSITLSAVAKQQNSSLTGTLSALSYNPYESMVVGLDNSR